MEVVAGEGGDFLGGRAVFEGGLGVEGVGEEAFEGGFFEGEGGVDDGFGFFISGVVVDVEGEEEFGAGEGGGEGFGREAEADLAEHDGGVGVTPP